MKTLIYRNNANTIKVFVKADIFATNQELQTPGFDTRFTRMEIGEGYNDAAKALFNLREVESGWIAAKILAQETPGIGLFIVDLSELSLVKQTQVDKVTLTGTSGTANINVNGVNYLATFTTNLPTSATNFVSSHSAALLAAGIVVTRPNADGVLVFTANVSGVPFDILDEIANVSGTLEGTLAHTTLNQSGTGEITIVAP